jgi:ParB family transcriptional regulator, chromosome partitioning protein
LSNWEGTDIHESFGTNGFRFQDDVDSDTCRGFHYEEMVGIECYKCPDFVSVFSGPKLYFFRQRACVGDANCYKKTTARTHPGVGAGAGTRGGGVPQTRSDEPRVAWHGAHFRGIFFEERIPKRFEEVSPRGVKALHLALIALIQLNGRIRSWFAEFYIREEDERPRWVRDEEIFGAIASMSIQDASEVLKEAVLQAVMGREFDGEGCRRLVAKHIGIDLAKEWRFNEGYLAKKRIAEMLQFGEELGIFEYALAQAYLHDTIGKERFDKCKKPELVDVFLKSGADLAGKLPKEILAR